ncbi:MAG: GNAT family N-acetyltransferase [Proteobacteria bacterium]|jgi:putative hemolysin|nr:GNAT family N-acetyltransferase [Pseudomonadota bacterium]
MAVLQQSTPESTRTSTVTERKRPAYVVRFARNEEEIRAALRLRYEVFNLELNEGLVSAHATGMDEDEFDEVCDHLIVVEEGSDTVVGTYRMQTGTMAGLHLGYYSACEFDFTPFEPFRDSLVELGRACVHRDHRSIAVISMLWREIVRYALDRNARYLIGCSSLTSQDPAHGRALYNRFAFEGHLADPEFRTVPLPAFELDQVEPLADCPPPPKLLRAYLGIGAKICSTPAIDRAFGTIDFLTMIDCFNADPAAKDRFVERPNGGNRTTVTRTVL